MGSEAQTQVLMLASSALYRLSHLPSPKCLVFGKLTEESWETEKQAGFTTCATVNSAPNGSKFLENISTHELKSNFTCLRQAHPTAFKALTPGETTVAVLLPLQPLIKPSHPPNRSSRGV